MSMETLQFADPRTFELDPSYQAYSASPFEALEQSRRARLLLAGSVMQQTVESEAQPTDVPHQLSYAALTKVGGLAVGFADGAQSTVQELFGARPVVNPRTVGAYALAA